MVHLLSFESATMKKTPCVVIFENVRFPSIRAAARILGLSPSTIAARCDSNEHVFRSWQWENKKRKREEVSGRRVSIGRKLYGNLSHAARILRLPRTTVRRWCSQGRVVNGVGYRYVPHLKPNK